MGIRRKHHSPTYMRGVKFFLVIEMKGEDSFWDTRDAISSCRNGREMTERDDAEG